MTTFNYTVDTEPMAREMESVSRHVDVTTGAVVAMQTAVIAAEASAADHVCANVNRGFYSLIRSQISQKLAKLQSEVDSNMMQLVQQKNALLGIRTRMQRDYMMIARRYTKLFNGLNANLKNRIFELDKPTIDFACREIDKVSNRTKYLTATIPINQLESISLSQKIISSYVRQKGVMVIQSMKGFIHEMNVQKKLTDQILIRDQGNTKIGASFIPVILYEAVRDKTDNNSIEVVVSPVQLNSIARSAIVNKVHEHFSGIEWKSKTEDRQEINSEFKKLAQASAKPSKVKELAVRLYESNTYLTV